MGFLKGSPKILQSNQLNKEFLDDIDGYFIRIRILDVGTKREFPLLSKIDDNGVRLFTNDMENDIIYIDRYGLEDAIRFQKVKYEILDGYYYNEGRQDNISNVIQHLFNTRKAYKDEKDEEGNEKPNPAEKVIKLLMNSVYGKTIMKPIDSDTKVVPDFDFERYTVRHYNYIKDSIKVGNHHYIKVIKSVDKHFNYVHCGVEVLSMSKRIMNEVMCLAEDNNLKIFYQDTDSMHIIYDHVEILAKLFKETEGRKLIGDELGEFHIDFDIFDEKGNKVKGVKNIKAIESYFIGKKTYFDTLRGVKDGKYVMGQHIRMKGIPSNCIKAKAQGENIQVIDIYKKLYEKEVITFDLTERTDNRPKFKNEKDFSIITLRKGDVGTTRRTSIKEKDYVKIMPTVVC